MDFRRLAWSFPVAYVRHLAEAAPTFMWSAVVARQVLFMEVI
jgi:hypothetical protein